jgi:transcriptional regulator with GAF, ATPase, and Fis domain
MNTSASREAAGDRPSAMFDRLAGIIYEGVDYDEVYAALCSSATRLVDGCDHASLMLRRQQRYITVAATDEIARRVDELERTFQDGPCIDAILEEVPQIQSDLTTTSDWPELATEIVRTTPVRGAAGFRIVVGDQKVGALNLFSDQPGSFTEASADQGIILAAFASVTLAAMGSQHRAESLAKGLDSNREIGKAVGLMMAFHKISDDAAFQILRKASQDMNLKLTEVARQVVDHHNSGRG